MALSDCLNNLVTQRDNLAENLIEQGVQANKTELLDTLVPKVLEIERGQTPFNIYVQLDEPESKNGIWLKTEDTFDNVEIVNTLGEDFSKIIHLPIDYDINSIYTLKLKDENNKDKLVTLNYHYINSSNKETSMIDHDLQNIKIANSIVRPVSDPLLSYENIHSFVGIDNAVWYIKSGEVNKIYKYNYEDSFLSSAGYSEHSPNFSWYFYDCAVANYRKLIYLFGLSSSYDGAYFYNTETKTIAARGYTPYKIRHASTAVVDDDIYIAGGYGENTEFNMYRIKVDDNTKTKLANTPISVFRGCTVSLGKYIYIFQEKTKNFYWYDTLNNIYTKLKNLERNYIANSAIAIKGYIYFVTAPYYSSESVCLYKYNPTADTFKENTFILQIVENHGNYSTQLYQSTDTLINNLQTSFDDAWIYKDGSLQEYPAYYGNGSEWIKFKN